MNKLLLHCAVVAISTGLLQRSTKGLVACVCGGPLYFSYIFHIIEELGALPIRPSLPGYIKWLQDIYIDIYIL